jgi:hypothetical protein
MNSEQSDICVESMTTHILDDTERSSDKCMRENIPNKNLIKRI